MEPAPVKVRRSDFPEAGKSRKVYYEEPEWARPASYDDGEHDLVTAAIDGLMDWLSSK